jgi:hypothetical protein
MFDYFSLVQHMQKMYLFGKTSISNFDRNVIAARLDWVCMGVL